MTQDGERDGGNPFCRISGGNELGKEGWVYAAFEVPEPEENQEQLSRRRGNGLPEPILLENFDAKWFDSVQSNGQHRSCLNIYRDAPLWANVWGVEDSRVLVLVNTSLR